MRGCADAAPEPCCLSSRQQIASKWRMRMTSRNMISIEGRPGPISIDPQETAVLVVDMQNDFGSEGGLFARAGIDIVPIQAVVPAIANLLATAHRAGTRVI